MPGRMPRSAPQSPFELPEVTAVVCATHLSCQNAGKAQKFTPVRGSSGESAKNVPDRPQSTPASCQHPPGSVSCSPWGRHGPPAQR
jgi:hypothetical protein